MKSLIAVRGVAKRGKSVCIKKLFTLLMNAYPDAVIESQSIGVDIKVMLRINGKRIGIESMGDPNSRLFMSLASFSEAGCKVIVCATRSRGQTVEAVEALNRKYRITWFEKRHEPLGTKHNVANAHDAQEILKLVQSALDA